ncbi:hypothetical protein PC129_g208 [Phytophthora cactorum]|uniref:Elicitin n=1 Tax=Phytophthora cactorum TaxID=29920 RepID=A0A329RQG2_9STRA|nr:hypothetical protein Pcac1_g8596 [Phytophthora cactorum]KAG2869439.1 hypothetical protein PC113_g241 [Phytophthora cactorum]KAG2936730.1 hypothetical protein PC114_g14 [Phytophthora cactorum]KAG3000735.1 hypothetical protein PC118_g134 [Phytophthora cactorum]KAG3036586.1 hypothetical protein PC120_g130 [Phytophthora cactorum]
MRAKRVYSWALAVLVAMLASHGVVSDCDESSTSMREYTAKQSRVAAGITSVNYTANTADSVEEGSSDVAASNSDGIASSITFPAATTVTPTIAPVSTEQPVATKQTPMEAPISTPVTTTPATIEPVAPIEFESPSTSQSDESSASAWDTTQSTTAKSSPIIVTSSSSEFSSSGSTSTSSSNSEASEINSSDGGPEEEEEDEASIAHPGSDTSTFQSVASAECSKKEVENVYTLYSSCRSAFDLCVSASDYQIFPFQGKHPTQTQIQDMVESDACVAVFIVVIGSNFSACTIGGMPLVSAVETLLKVSVDLEQGLEDEAPPADEFQELVAWRYQVDLAKAASVPFDGSSALYAEFETNLNTALENTTIRVNEDLSVDVRLSNGTYETFEDAIDLIVTDASAADLGPGYVVASSATGSSSSSSSRTTGVVIESSIAAARCAPTLWSLHVVHVVAVVASVVVLAERRSGVVLVEWRTMLLDTVVERASTLLEINAVRGAAPDKTKTARQLVKRGLVRRNWTRVGQRSAKE